MIGVDVSSHSGREPQKVLNDLTDPEILSHYDPLQALGPRSIRHLGLGSDGLNVYLDF